MYRKLGEQLLEGLLHSLVCCISCVLAQQETVLGKHTVSSKAHHDGFSLCTFAMLAVSSLRVGRGRSLHRCD